MIYNVLIIPHRNYRHPDLKCLRIDIPYIMMLMAIFPYMIEFIMVEVADPKDPRSDPTKILEYTKLDSLLLDDS